MSFYGSVPSLQPVAFEISGVICAINFASTPRNGSINSCEGIGDDTWAFTARQHRDDASKIHHPKTAKTIMYLAEHITEDLLRRSIPQTPVPSGHRFAIFKPAD
jgi:hypothetical protein